jgi:hypothetical protein
MDTLFANAIKKSSAFCKISAAACALLVGSSAFAEFKMDDIKLTEFRANGIYSSNTTGNTTSGELGWFPSGERIEVVSAGSDQTISKSRHSGLDSSKALPHLGWSVQSSPQQAVAKVIDWYLSQKM